MWDSLNLDAVSILVLYISYRTYCVTVLSPHTVKTPEVFKENSLKSEVNFCKIFKEAASDLNPWKIDQIDPQLER